MYVCMYVYVYVCIIISFALLLVDNQPPLPLQFCTGIWASGFFFLCYKIFEVQVLNK